MKKASIQNRKIRKSGVFWTFVILLCFSTACKDKTEGCKDFLAENWDASADTSCEDCCSYPSLNLTFSHVYGDTTFRYGTAYQDSALNFYKITSIRYYLSDFRLTAGTENYRVTDSLETTIFLNGEAESATIHDDAVFAAVGSSTISIGEFPTRDLYLDSLSFSVGLSQTLNSVNPGSVPNSHPLAPKPDSMYWDESRGYIFQRLEIIPDFSIQDTITLEIGGDDLLRTVNLAYGKTTSTGFDQEIPITVDYRCWFTGINFAMDTEAEMKEKIVNNIANCFSITE